MLYYDSWLLSPHTRCWLQARAAPARVRSPRTSAASDWSNIVARRLHLGSRPGLVQLCDTTAAAGSIHLAMPRLSGQWAAEHISCLAIDSIIVTQLLRTETSRMTLRRGCQFCSIQPMVSSTYSRTVDNVWYSDSAACQHDCKCAQSILH